MYHTSHLLQAATGHSELPHTIVACHSGTTFKTCCEAKKPNAATCKGTLAPSVAAPGIASHKMQHKTRKIKPVQSPELGYTHAGPAPAGMCNGNVGTCNTTAGSMCVYISGGKVNTPRCTCNTVADCPTDVPNNGCSEYTPTMPNNYKGNICQVNKAAFG